MSFVDCRSSFDGEAAGGANDTMFVHNDVARKVRRRRPSCCNMFYMCAPCSELGMKTSS